MKLIVGLGNPGKRYEKTRHNVGFMALDRLADLMSTQYTVSDWNLSKKFNVEISGFSLGGEKIILAKPMTYMNASGQSVQLIMGFYNILPKDLIVVHDDKDIQLGEVKLQHDRGHAGHNGIKSITQCVGSNKYDRLRIGVASSNQRKMQDTSKFVLSKFGIFEKKHLLSSIDEACSILQEIFE